MIWDSLTVEKKLRDNVLNELKSHILKEFFFKDEEHQKSHESLLKIKEDIKLCTDYGVKTVGFIYNVPESPRNLGKTELLELLS